MGAGWSKLNVYLFIGERNRKQSPRCQLDYEDYRWTKSDLKETFGQQLTWEEACILQQWVQSLKTLCKANNLTKLKLVGDPYVWRMRLKQVDGGWGRWTEDEAEFNQTVGLCVRRKSRCEYQINTKPAALFENMYILQHWRTGAIVHNVFDCNGTYKTLVLGV